MEVPPKTASRIFLIDAYALIYRSYFAFIQRPLTNALGENTSAPFGFANFLYSIRDNYQPDYIAVVFDSGHSHREKLFPEYKATRTKMPEELRESLPRIRELVAAFGDTVVEKEGWEADDVIGTLAKQAVAQGLEAVIVSGDKDFFQLVGKGVHLLNPGRRGQSSRVLADWVDESNAREKFDVAPAQVVDFLALVGDSSDNVPGAHGIGPKTARKLLETFGTLDELLEHADEVTAKRVREALIQQREQILLSRELVTIKADLKLDTDLEDLRVTEPDLDRLRALYQKLDFLTLLVRVDRERGRSWVAPEVEYSLVTEPEKVDKIVEECRRAGSMGLAVFTETMEPTRGGVAGIAIAPGLADSDSPDDDSESDTDREPGGTAFYLPFAHGGEIALELAGVADPDVANQVGQDASTDGELSGAPDPTNKSCNLPPLTSDIFTSLLALLADKQVTKVGHDLKSSLIACRRAGIELAGPLKDVMVAAYVLDPGRRYDDLPTLAKDFLGLEAVRSKKLLRSGKKRRAFRDVPAKEALTFTSERADLSLRLWARFSKRLEAQKMEKLFAEMETPLIPILADMEMAGVGIDVPFLAEMNKKIKGELAQIRAEIYRVAGTEFNINSTVKLREILFDALQLPILKKTKTGPSTDSSVLERLAMDGHELPRLLLEYRQLDKLCGTYVQALPALVNPQSRRIHTTFNQTVAATGRLSSSNPNLQNIPIRTEVGRQIRRGFIAAPGSLLLTADYSQIELRILAHFSGDEVFTRAFQEDKDVHRETAAVIFGVPVAQVTGQMRDQAKTVNFATIYGQGPFGLAQQLQIPVDQARTFIDQYFDRFAGVRNFLDEQVKIADATGYSTTLLGRRRQIPELRSRNWNTRRFGERVAQNTPIQGTAADLIKLAMLRLGTAVTEWPYAQMLIQVHDELVFEVEEDHLDEVRETVVEVMESAAALEVPLRVDAGYGKTWFDCKR